MQSNPGDCPGVFCFRRVDRTAVDYSEKPVRIPVLGRAVEGGMDLDEGSEGHGGRSSRQGLRQLGTLFARGAIGQKTDAELLEPLRGAMTPRTHSRRWSTAMGRRYCGPVAGS